MGAVAVYTSRVCIGDSAPRWVVYTARLGGYKGAPGTQVLYTSVAARFARGARPFFGFLQNCPVGILFFVQYCTSVSAETMYKMR